MALYDIPCGTVTKNNFRKLDFINSCYISILEVKIFSDSQMNIVNDL